MRDNPKPIRATGEVHRTNVYENVFAHIWSGRRKFIVRKTPEFNPGDTVEIYEWARDDVYRQTGRYVIGFIQSVMTGTQLRAEGIGVDDNLRIIQFNMLARGEKHEQEERQGEKGS
jgi:hypothetical protein